MAWNNKAKFNQYGCPCVADCEQRCVGCRSTCEAFQAYETKRIESDKAKHYNAYDAGNSSVYARCKPFTASTFRIYAVNDRIRQQRARGDMI